MSDSTDLNLDMREFCARVLREYEEVIATIILRPVPAAEPGPGIGALAIDGGVPAEPV